MEFSVRQARFEDIPDMCRLLEELFLIEKDFMPDMEKQERGLSLLVNDKSGRSLVVVADNGIKIIGMCSVQLLFSTAEGGNTGLVEDLVVRKDSRGRGIGKGLLAGICRWCKDHGISRLQLLRDVSNIKALTFYSKLGWKETDLTCMRRFLP
ncbi:putative acetyltransferase [bacterium BMS3Abin07]|nr:putative acetyltransferase [bacterium BMS3Abin07]GBE31723.1 putative acetyltransferase [bacterium BMS3Bbin05]HDL21341.1 GNAT family N-acetyltransferase [Nitrospirota bacterium]HDO23344.1 GNAT family N-acetyltransferase [Nitrospirota bacterium]HDZ87422.1 GNAT family N-acetyltransferase [Nitrospirota bacterium]